MPEFVVDVEGSHERLDIWISRQLPDLSRARCQTLIKQGNITLNGRQAKARTWLAAGDQVTVKIPPPVPAELIPEDTPLEILFEDESIIVLNKPPGAVVHPGAGHETGTLVHALLHHCGPLPGINGEERPGVVHRLDKDTSGVILFAKTEAALVNVAQQFQNRVTTKRYAAIVHGQPARKEQWIEEPIGRSIHNRKKMAVHMPNCREARTHFRVMEQFAAHASLDLNIETGRTHQIRVHLSHIGHPVLGDALYGGGRRGPVQAERQMLHARMLGIAHPVSGDKVAFEASIPFDMQAILDQLKNESDA